METELKIHYFEFNLIEIALRILVLVGVFVIFWKQASLEISIAFVLAPALSFALICYIFNHIVFRKNLSQPYIRVDDKSFQIKDLVGKIYKYELAWLLSIVEKKDSLVIEFRDPRVPVSYHKVVVWKSSVRLCDLCLLSKRLHLVKNTLN